MGMAKALRKLLDDAEIAYEVIDHGFQVTSKDIANSAHIASDRLAKSVLLHDEKGYVIAVLAGSHMIDLVKLKELTGRDLTMASEDEIGVIFRDCDLGAIPPVGAAYGLEVVMGKDLDGMPDVYFEAGDHRLLVRVAGTDFGKLMEGAQRGEFHQSSSMPSTP